MRLGVGDRGLDGPDTLDRPQSRCHGRQHEDGHRHYEAAVAQHPPHPTRPAAQSVRDGSEGRGSSRPAAPRGEQARTSRRFGHPGRDTAFARVLHVLPAPTPATRRVCPPIGEAAAAAGSRPAGSPTPTGRWADTDHGPRKRPGRPQAGPGTRTYAGCTSLLISHPGPVRRASLRDVLDDPRRPSGRRPGRSRPRRDSGRQTSRCRDRRPGRRPAPAGRGPGRRGQPARDRPTRPTPCPVRSSSRSPRPAGRPKTSPKPLPACSTRMPSPSTRAGRRSRTSGSAPAPTRWDGAWRCCTGSPTLALLRCVSSSRRCARCCSRRSPGSGTSPPSPCAPATKRRWTRSWPACPTTPTRGSSWWNDAGSSRCGVASSTSSRRRRSTRCGWSSSATRSTRYASSPSPTSAAWASPRAACGRRRAVSCC